jgi:hypothetical protein
MSQKRGKSSSTKIPSPINRLLNSNGFSILTSLTSSSQSSVATNSVASASAISTTATTFINNNNGISSISNTASNMIITSDFEKVDKKLFDKTCKLIDKVVRLCQQEKLNLINSPPYIIDILPDIYNHLNHISTAYENKIHILNEIDYFIIFMNTLSNKCDKVAKLFRDAGKRIFEDASNERKELIKYSLIFSHMLAELKSLFPNFVYDDKFRIAKADAAEFWKTNFNEKYV